MKVTIIKRNETKKQLGQTISREILEGDLLIVHDGPNTIELQFGENTPCAHPGLIPIPTGGGCA